jgi:signal transduction histidine kinase
VDLERHVQELTTQLEAARGDGQKSSSVEMASLLIAQEESQRIIEQLQLENGELRAGKRIQSSASPTQMEHELKASLQELARLQNQLADANIKAHELEKGQVTAKSTEQAEVIASISQELRQPLSSIVGYTDLLLGESVGILGALQRKFVERIKASTERIHSLMDDMIQITTLEAELNDLKPEAVDLNVVIDNAMSYTSAQVREKNISMHLELPKKLVPIQADREALQQILIHLLQNAGAATPFEGTVRLKVQTQTEEAKELILIQVTDTGGGIPATDLPRVFTRLYRADNVLIQGVGDTGVGLSIAKTLTEAHHGRIWVESEKGVGSTFSVLLPITGDGIAQKSPKVKGKK